MLNVPVVNNNVAQCFIPVCVENVISMYCKYVGVEYETIFTQAYNFSFNKKLCEKNKRVADGLSVVYDSVMSLEKLYGIKIEKKRFNDFLEAIEFLKTEISQNRPCIIHMDSFELPWSNFYKKEHTEHLVLAVEIDIENETIKVIDSIDKLDVMSLYFGQVKKGSKFALEVAIPPNVNKIDQWDLEKKIICNEFTVVNSSRFNDMIKFAHCFLDFFSPDVEFRDKEDMLLMSTEKLVDEIRKYIKGINLFVIWMMWRDKTEGVDRFEDIIIRYQQIMSKWNMFINTLYKKSLTIWNDNFAIQAYERIIEIIELERSAYKGFIGVLKNKRRGTSRKRCFNGVTDENRLLMLDLFSYFNNKGFSFQICEKVADLTGAGEHFCLPNQLEDITYINNIPYKFEICKEKDNISCKGQKIDFERLCYVDNLYIVSCAEWGGCIERLEIVNSKDAKLFYPFRVEDISEYKKDNACIVGSTYGDDGNIIRENAAVFSQSINIHDNVKYIRLPNADNLHILAITFSTR